MEIRHAVPAHLCAGITPDGKVLLVDAQRVIQEEIPAGAWRSIEPPRIDPETGVQLEPVIINRIVG